ncbi:hypothetical protein PhCBS80983_g05015 [Powellomyces hirtus]|uniref:Uncharacterized protein n=1 Tax=Powellomyces hirtus TaxID=109895 RepID=A0A507DWA7_9FUNG|nr:hypothetical protein PhCBS80983_g05015 [Powellomyces hirtus]
MSGGTSLANLAPIKPKTPNDALTDREAASSSPTDGHPAKSASKKKVALGTQIAKQIIKGGKKGAAAGPGEFKLDELDEAVLRSRLNTLEAELVEYKAKCSRHKQENEWYRAEIESCQRDTAEYILYLESKKSEKQSAIDSLIDGSKKDFDAFLENKKAKELQNQTEIQTLRAQIAEMEEKIDQKQLEVNGLSDVMSHRAKHEADIARLQREMQESERLHRNEIQELERTLLEERIKVQKETDAKIKEMESAAHEKAHGYLTHHIATINNENERLSANLRHLIIKTQQLLAQKEGLQNQNMQLTRDSTVRKDIINMRLQKIAASESTRQRGRERKRRAECEVRKTALEAVARVAERSAQQADQRPMSTSTMLRLPGPERRGIAEITFNSSALGGEGTLASLTIEDGDLDWSDEEDDQYL